MTAIIVVEACSHILHGSHDAFVGFNSIGAATWKLATYPPGKTVLTGLGEVMKCPTCGEVCTIDCKIERGYG